MNKDTYDLTPVPQKDIFTYTDMTENEFEDLVVNLFDKHAKKIGDHWVNEDGLDQHTVHDFARDLRAVLAAANGPLQATTSRPLPVIPWSGSNLTEMEELLQKVQQLERENAALREDKERLDWLEVSAIPWRCLSLAEVDRRDPIVVSWQSNDNLRAAIDAARAEEDNQK